MHNDSAAPVVPSTAPADSTSSSSSAAASTPVPSARKLLPQLPFQCRVQYGEGTISRTATAATPTAAALYDTTASTPHLPIIPMHAAPAVMHIRLLLHPRYRRGDVGSLISAIKVAQVELKYLFGWTVKMETDDEKEIQGIKYPVLQLILWSNPSLSSNTQLVAAQRAVLSRFPSVFSSLFGGRETCDLIRAAVQSVYMEHGMPTHHEPLGTRGGATEGEKEEEDELEAHIGIKFRENLGQILAVLQRFMQARTEEEEEADKRRIEQRIMAEASVAAAESKQATAAAAAAVEASPLASLAALAPTSSSAAASSSSSSSSSPSPPPPVVPFSFDLRHPLLDQFPRSVHSCLSLLKKSAAFLYGLDVELRTEQKQMGNFERIRHAKIRMKGCDVQSIYAFLQHKLTTTSGDNTNENTDTTSTAASSSSSTSASSFFQRLSGLRLLAEFLGFIHALPHPAVSSPPVAPSVSTHSTSSSSSSSSSSSAPTADHAPRPFTQGETIIHRLTLGHTI